MHFLHTPFGRIVLATTVAAGILVQQPLSAAQQRVVRLRNAFIDAIKNHATITDLSFRFDHVKTSINSISSGGKDGDIHAAGRPGPFVALPMVAEVVNARLEKDDVVAAMRAVEGRAAVKISGVWRLWFEHPPKEVLVQGGTVPVPDDTNPDHVFELHPLTAVNGHDADLSFVPIEGYAAYTAERAFKAYERLEFRAKRNSVFTTLASTQSGFNYTEFEAVLAGKPMHINDATFVLADVLDDAGNSVVAKPRRLVIADETKVAAAFAAKSPKKGTKMTVLGIPRVNLDKLMDEAEQAPGETVVVKGAYEIIVVGVR
jgi:hypothetical protein